jgi:acyl dehydratase
MALEAGAALPELRIASVEPERMRAMAVLLQDPNPIHIHAEVVKGLGMGDRVINQGPANMGYIANLLVSLAPGAEVERLSVRFMANVFGGDAVVAGGTVESVERDDAGGRRLSCAVHLDVEGGGRALEGRAVVRLPA